MEPLRLNLGCGKNKIEGYVNIDVEEACEPDLVHDFLKAPLPYEDNSVDEILLFHTIEHINKRLHIVLLMEFWRVLRPNGTIIISFPEFSRCIDNWKTNKSGMREFWEATIFGRQLYPSDFHVCAMDSREFSSLMREVGFDKLVCKAEPVESYNSFIAAVKGQRLPAHEDVIKAEMESLVLEVS